MLTGQAHVLAWCGAMPQAAQEGKAAWKSLGAALSVPIPWRRCPDAGSCSVATLLFSENAFASAAAAGADSLWKSAERVALLPQFQKGSSPISKVAAVRGVYGIRCKGKAVSGANANVLKSFSAICRGPCLPLGRLVGEVDLSRAP